MRWLQIGERTPHLGALGGAGGGQRDVPLPGPSPPGERTVISCKEVLIYWRGKKKDIDQISPNPQIIKRINFNKYIFKRFKNISNYI